MLADLVIFYPPGVQGVLCCKGYQIFALFQDGCQADKHFLFAIKPVRDHIVYSIIGNGGFIGNTV